MLKNYPQLKRTQPYPQNSKDFRRNPSKKLDELKVRKPSGKPGCERKR